ncbi:MAG: trypsin-like peptidase domain-containing protein [Clostridia bacterium]|nr:trypsin-like peptidase domain-containing protein [Clostridia bacterium]
MKIVKKIAAGLAVIMCVMGSTAMAAGDANVYVNGQKINEDAYIINDRVYVPLRAVGEALGAEVAWDNNTRSAIVEQTEDDVIVSTIATASQSVVTIVGNYKSDYISADAQNYNELYAHGAGVVIKSNGTILTNAHVVEGIQNLTVIFGNGDSYSGSVQYIDKVSDLALVKINKLGLKPMPFAAENSLKVGQTVIAIGTPLSVNHINSASKGIVSGINVNIGQHYLFTQSDVAINGGNSGGPLINTKGELVGINSIKYVGTDVEGMSFSIPVDTVNYVITSFEKYGKVLRPDIGITFTESWESKIGVPTKKGLSVTGSKNPQIQPGDMITHVNYYEVHSIADYNEAIKKSFNGYSVTLTFTRGGVVSVAEITTN